MTGLKLTNLSSCAPPPLSSTPVYDVDLLTRTLLSTEQQAAAAAGEGGAAADDGGDLDRLAPVDLKR